MVVLLGGEQVIAGLQVPDASISIVVNQETTEKDACTRWIGRASRGDRKLGIRIERASQPARFMPPWSKQYVIGIQAHSR